MEILHREIPWEITRYEDNNRIVMAHVIFIHKGKLPKHLKMAINHVKKFMPGYKIILITDIIHTKIKNVETHNISLYETTATKFSKIYTHRSSNSYFFELICFQRWFILNDFVERQNIKGQLLYLDSDVLIYMDLFKIIDLDNKRMTVTNGFGPQYSLFKNGSAVQEYCDFIHFNFTDKKAIKFLDNWYQTRFVDLKVVGGVCDMTLLWLFDDLGKCKEIFSSNVYFNSTIRDIEKDALKLGFNKADFNLVNFYLKNNRAFILDIPVAALHFQGKSKEVMHRFYFGADNVWYKYIYEFEKRLSPVSINLYGLYRRVYLKLKYPNGLPSNHNK